MKVVSLLSGIAAIILMSCGGSMQSQQQTTDKTTANSVETENPNTNYKPAFAGQTRIPSVTTKEPYTVTVLSSDLKKPWGITTLPDGRFLITEKQGSLRISSTMGVLSAPITNIPTVNADGQGGLLDILVDPNFDKTRLLYWTFSLALPEGNCTAVAKGNLSTDEKQIENISIIYKALPAHKSNLHYGSRILMDSTGNLIVSTGERSDLETRPLAQSLQAALGKVLRITTDGKPAPDNPFISTKNALPEIYSYGHRNVQGLALHPVTGELWETEFGPRGGDELNCILPGKNYGWPTITYGIEYSGKKIGNALTQMAGMEQPIYYWDPVLSPSGICFYNSDVITQWKNNLFICGLSSQHISRLIIENKKVVGEERLLNKEGQRFRDITQGKDGNLYAVTDQGRLYKIGLSQK